MYLAARIKDRLCVRKYEGLTCLAHGWFFRPPLFLSRVRSNRSSELHRAKKDIKSEVEERYLLNAEEIAQVRTPR